MSTAVEGLQPAPETCSKPSGGPDVAESCAPGVTTKFVLLLPVPARVLTAILPVATLTGAVATILVALMTLKVAVAPSKVTAVAPVKREPESVTLVPMVPVPGANAVIAGAAASAKPAS